MPTNSHGVERLVSAELAALGFETLDADSVQQIRARILAEARRLNMQRRFTPWLGAAACVGVLLILRMPAAGQRPPEAQAVSDWRIALERTGTVFNELLDPASADSDADPVPAEYLSDPAPQDG